MFDTRGFMEQHVYPALDAAARGLLDPLHPVAKNGGAYYILDCPNCQKREAFYRAGHKMLMCNRREECKHKQSIWDYVQNSQNLSQQETFEALCEAAGIEKPALGNGADAVAGKGESEERKMARIAKDVFRDLLKASPEALGYLTGKGEGERRLTMDEVAQLPLGYYPNAAAVAKGLQSAGLSIEVAQRWGLLPPNRDMESPYSRRVVSYWPIQDGTWRLVGRAIDRDRKPKYLYASSENGFNRTVPYNFKPGSRGLLVGVEGFFDALAYELMGVPACAIGGAEVTRAQATHMLSRNVRTFVHVIDGDSAGRDGGAKSVEICEARDITVLIGVSPRDEDADSLRQQGREKDAIAVVDQAVSGGEFLAQELLARLDLQGPTAAADRGELRRRRAGLTPDSALAFTLYFHRLDIDIEDPRVSALRTVLNMTSEGIDWDQAVKRVRDRYALDLTVGATKRDG